MFNNDEDNEKTNIEKNILKDDNSFKEEDEFDEAIDGDNVYEYF